MIAFQQLFLVIDAFEQGKTLPLLNPKGSKARAIQWHLTLMTLFLECLDASVENNLSVARNVRVFGRIAATECLPSPAFGIPRGSEPDIF
jgi:hypothetical protein